MKTTFTQSICLIAILLPFAGCKSIPKRSRNTVPQELVNQAVVPGIPDARQWGDEMPPYIEEILQSSNRQVAKRFPGIVNGRHTYLAISGGGSNGAYGSAMLVGWSAKGDRPTFTLVSGISTGAIIAPFAFLGSEYDPVLIDLYTTKSTKDVLTERNRLKALNRDAFNGTQPLRELIAGYLGEREIERIAEEHRNGRRLLVGTVNLDMMRPVSWDIGAIAASGQPCARELIIDIILASAAIPVAMPPVFIDVEANGEIYQEMHVDGGLFSQVMTYPITMHWDEIEKKLNTKGTTKFYVIRNAKIHPGWKDVQPQVLHLASRAISSLTRTQGLGNIYQLYFTAQRDGIDLHLTFIPADFQTPSNELFDPTYMNALFTTGYESITEGDPWIKQLD